MYGGGGYWDVLTRKSGVLRFTWDGQSAQIDFRDGDCTAVSWYTGWSVLDCSSNGFNDGPSASVHRSGEGTYYWVPGSSWYPAFYHHLYDSEWGYANGTGTCVYDWSGTIVIGVYNDCSVSP